MTTKSAPEKWPECYQSLISRQIGYVEVHDQDKLKNMRILVAGVGGIGGPLVEQLVRIGCENLVILDHDVFEPSNLNRQLCTREDIGKSKVAVIAERMAKINPDAKVTPYAKLSTENVDAMLQGVAVVALCLDGPVASILLARACRQKKIPLVETWATPFLFSWWFLPDSMPYESVYGLKTQQYAIDELETNADLAGQITRGFMRMFLVFPGIVDLFARDKTALTGTLHRKLPLRSICPVVWISAANLAKEIIYRSMTPPTKHMLAPHIRGYDYIRLKPFNLSPLKQRVHLAWNYWTLRRMGIPL